VHRLDKLTSDLWLLAKTPAAAAESSAQFAQRSLGKFYLVLTDRKPCKKQAAIEGALVKSRGGSYRLARQSEPWSRTQFFGYGLGDGYRLFLLKPLTGRTYQIRVVLTSIGAPIIGDSRYYENALTGAKGLWGGRC
jgi:tRNA pseudouridine32 synthase/23S rRNA pseudouridine746 synthase